MATRPGDERPCRRCKMRLVFLEGKSGPDRPMPAQRIKAIYRRVGNKAERIELSGDLFAEDQTIYVNHYETCPHAGEFSRPTAERRDK